MTAATSQDGIDMTEPTHNVPGERPNLQVLLIEESPTALAIRRQELQHAGWIEIVGEATSSQNALALFFQLKPQAVIVSTCLSVQSGLEVLRCIKRVFPQCPVVLTIRQSDSFVTEAARLLGATAVCCLSDHPAQLVRILEGLDIKPGTAN